MNSQIDKGAGLFGRWFSPPVVRAIDDKGRLVSRMTGQRRIIIKVGFSFLFGMYIDGFEKVDDIDPVKLFEGHLFHASLFSCSPCEGRTRLRPVKYLAVYCIGGVY